MILRKISLLSLLVCSVCLPLFAAPRAVIVVGLTADDVQAKRFQQAADQIQSGLVQRGIQDIDILGATGNPRVKREEILTTLAANDGVTAVDEVWIVLIGTSTMRGGEPSFQISGPRVTAKDLTAAVESMPGQKRVVIATSSSGGFLPLLLQLPAVEAVAATGDSGEINEPRFIEMWTQALLQNPADDFAQLAKQAAGAVGQFYTETQLAQGEHARLIDRATGTILKAPFDAGKAAASAGPQSGSRRTAPAVSSADIEIPKPSGELDIEHLPATDETRALIAEARAEAEKTDHAGLILRTEFEVTVGRDFSTRELWNTRSYTITGESLDDLGTVRLPSSRSNGLSRLIGARVIRPDASQILINLPKLAAGLRDDKADEPTAPNAFQGPTAPPVIELPEVTAGCIVELSYSHEIRDSAHLPAFYNEWHLAERYPVLGGRIQIHRPVEKQWHTFSVGLDQPEVEDGDNLRTETWTLPALAAFEPLPGDPPARTFSPWIGVSSLESWDDFAAWYKRLAAGSEQADSHVEALADEIAAAHSGRMARIQAAYERVAALRYVAIELGVGAFRPRTPGKVWAQRYGDCKDKANLLVAILRHLDIDAEFVLVNRFDVTFTEFPGWQFNHAIARVPAAPDAGQPHALWLDTTDRLVPFGIIAPGDLGRQGLVFSEGFESAEFHEITGEQEPPAVWREQFTHERISGARELRVSATGAAEVVLRQTFANLPPQIRRERIRQMLGWGTATIERVDMPDPYDLSVPFVLTVKFNPSSVVDTRITPRALVPGLAAYAHRFKQPPWSGQLVWNDGRDWTFYRSEGDTESTHPIPGQRTQFPPEAPSPVFIFPY